MRGRPTLVLVALVIGSLIAGCTVTDKAAMTACVQAAGLRVAVHPEGIPELLAS